MIVCSSCGHHNESDDTFCGSCGAFLEWEAAPGTAEAPAAAVAVAAEAEAAAPAPPVDEAAQARAAAVAEKHERAQREAAEADQQRKDAEARAKSEEAAAQAARDQAQAAEAARKRAEDQAEQEAEAAAQLRARLEEVEASRKQAQEQLEREMAALEEQRGTEAEKVRSELEANLAAERAKVDEARRRAEEAEKERIVADARAEAEAKAAQEAARKVEEAEKARLAAEEQAKQEQEAAERAKRAAALVARPPQTVTKPAKKATTAKPPADAADATTEDPDATPPGPQAPAAVKPARSKVRQGPKKKTAPSRTIRPGDLVCGECGEGNTPERKFCRRCGATLEDAEPAPKLPWWRRLRRKPKTYAAGERRGRGPGAKGKARNARRGMRRVKASLGFLVILLGGLGIAVAPIRNQVTGWVGDRVDQVRGVVAPDLQPVRPFNTTATSEAPDHPAEHATDLTSNRWWASTGGDDGIGERLTASFQEPVDIRVVAVRPGAADPAEYAVQPRPRELRLIFDSGATATVELTDEHEFQTFDIRGAEDTTEVVIEVLSVYRGTSGSQMAITELEFRAVDSP